MKKYLFQVALFFYSFSMIGCKEDEKKENTLSLATVQKGAGATADICTDLEKYYKEYMDSVESKQQIRKEYDHKMVPIDEELGKGYIDAYRTSAPGQTHMMVLDIKTVAFLYKYLSDHPGDSIGLSFGKYDPFIGGRDVRYQRRASMPHRPPIANRHTIIIGVSNRSMLYGIKPFNISGYSAFYDDWNDEWP